MTKYIGFIEINHHLYRPCQRNFFKTPHNIQWKPSNFTPWTVTVPTSNMNNANYCVILSSKWIFLECQMTRFTCEHFDIICSHFVFFSLFSFFIIEGQFTTAEKKLLSSAQKCEKTRKNCFAIDEMVCNCFSCFSHSFSRFTSHTNYLKCFSCCLRLLR